MSWGPGAVDDHKGDMCDWGVWCGREHGSSSSTCGDRFTGLGLLMTLAQMLACLSRRCGAKRRPQWGQGMLLSTVGRAACVWVRGTYTW